MLGEKKNSHPSSAILTDLENKSLEIDLFLDAVFQQYGYDFRHYARASLKRRIENCRVREKKEHIAELISCVIHERGFFDRFLHDMSVRLLTWVAWLKHVYL